MYRIQTPTQKFEYRPAGHQTIPLVRVLFAFRQSRFWWVVGPVGSNSYHQSFPSICLMFSFFLYFFYWPQIMRMWRSLGFFFLLWEDSKSEEQGVSLCPLKPHGIAAVFLICSMTSSAHVLKLIFIYSRGKNEVGAGWCFFCFFFFSSLQDFHADVSDILRLQSGTLIGLQGLCCESWSRVFKGNV